jgi:hypothetical protein
LNRVVRPRFTTDIFNLTCFTWGGGTRGGGVVRVFGWFGWFLLRLLDSFGAEVTKNALKAAENFILGCISLCPE